jgi:hypothetical protein
MAHSNKEYIPNNDAKFEVWFSFLITYVLNKISGTPPAWPHIPSPAFSLLQSAYNAWYAVYEVTLGPHTPVDTAAKNEGKKAAVKTIRAFVNQYLRFPPVTDDERIAMGVPNRDTTRTPIGRPETVPVFSVVIKGIRRVTIPFHDEDSERRAIPYGLNGAVVFWKIADAPITNPDLLDRTELATRSPHTLHFKEEERGKTVTIALQWQNEAGVRGDYSELESVIVP